MHVYSRRYAVLIATLLVVSACFAIYGFAGTLPPTTLFSVDWWLTMVIALVFAAVALLLGRKLFKMKKHSSKAS